MQGVIDPASCGSSQIDGRKLIEMYSAPELGLRLEFAENTIEAGLMEVWNQLVSGRLRVQAHLSNWLSEFRKYHRDEKGKIVKANDHLMDATRYLVISGEPYLQYPPTRKQMDRSYASAGGVGAFQGI